MRYIAVAGYRFRRMLKGWCMSDVECSSKISGPTQQKIDSRIKDQLEAQIAQQGKQCQTQMANMTSVFTAYMEQVRSMNPSVPLPDFSDFRTPTSAQMNGLHDSNEVWLEDIYVCVMKKQF
ncbi:unnamed protein product [Cuscuta epithymum]|uniref:Uncharacterized protein n=1 Tax=Cuscuta epithymum TaxID=186058 RepID=A0AAV0FRE3_9ASTE|nr:unnamed protein product [Cuscuta epithymum]